MWPFLFDAMRSVSIPEKAIIWISSLYQGLYISFIVNKTLRKSINVSQGLQQGEQMSPILFNFALNLILAAMKRVLTRLLHPAQWQLKAIEFPDNNVVGLGEKMDVAKAMLVLCLYQ